MTKLIIEAGRTDERYWRDLWSYRELFYFLAWRDVLLRYRQTAIGVLWALIRPLLTMVIFSIIFGRVAKMPSGGIPYPMLVLSGMLPWQFFSNALSESSGSLVLNSALISKIYFPRMIVPASTLIVSMVDFGIALIVLIGFMFRYSIAPGLTMLLLPVFILLAIIASLGPGLLVAALNVKFRDFRYVIPFLLQLGLYTSPVGFSSSVIANNWRLLYSLNPMVGVIDGFRWCIYGTAPLYLPGLAMSMLSATAMLWIGVAYFRKTEKTFADII
jgi:lipopolysaccharide transport system permease protein